MNVSLSLINCLDDMPQELIEADRSFELDDKKLHLSVDLIDTEVLNRLTYRISKKPHCLFAHVQRIYCCFLARNSERLYGALVDFLLVLNKRGLAIGRRMIAGSGSILSSEQIQTLHYYGCHATADVRLLPGNRYSIFSKGMIGTLGVIKRIEKESDSKHDPLILARDFIEYSQLDEARSVLEEAILEHPDRQELHDELLTLYRSTQDQASFAKMHSMLMESGITVPRVWEQTVLHFQQLK